MTAPMAVNAACRFTPQAACLFYQDVALITAIKIRSLKNEAPIHRIGAGSDQDIS